MTTLRDLWWILLLIAIAGCGDSGSQGSQVPAPEVLETIPEDMAREVELTVLVEGRLNADIEASALTADRFSLTAARGTSVDGTLSIGANNDAFRFEPTTPLGLLTGHTATLTAGVLGVGGGALSDDYVWSFVTRDGQWGDAEPREEEDTYSAFGPRVAAGPDRSWFVVWLQSDGAVLNLWANRFTMTNGWGDPEIIEPGSGDADVPTIGVDAQGNAIALWRNCAARCDIWTNRFIEGQTWGTAEPIELPTGDEVNFVEAVVHTDGSATAVLLKSEPDPRDVWAVSYDPAADEWGLPELLEPNSGAASTPRIAIGPTGDVFAVWTHDVDGGFGEVWANRRTEAQGWETATKIQQDGDARSGFARVAVGPDGEAIAVWHQSDGVRDNIWANRFDPAVVRWGEAKLIEVDNAGDARNPRIVIDLDGNAVAAWQQSNGTRSQIVANRYTAGGDWGTPERVEMNDGDVSLAQLAIDNNGNAIAIWSQGEGLASTWAARFTTSDGWQTPELLESDDAGDAFDQDVAIGSSGEGLAVWRQSDGNLTSIWSNPFR